MCFVRTASGTFHDGDLLLNQKGLRLISEENESCVRFSLSYFIYSLVCFQLLILLGLQKSFTICWIWHVLALLLCYNIDRFRVSYVEVRTQCWCWILRYLCFCIWFWCIYWCLLLLWWLLAQKDFDNDCTRS